MFGWRGRVTATTMTLMKASLILLSFGLPNKKIGLGEST
jgi:hypothetical protein